MNSFSVVERSKTMVLPPVAIAGCAAFGAGVRAGADGLVVSLHAVATLATVAMAMMRSR
jgi:hypothetical protein